MPKIKELNYTSLKNTCNPKALTFKNTSQLEASKNIIGQDRAVKSLEFGLKVKTRGYNIYISGSTGTGKTSYAQNYINKIAQNYPIPDDWCYVYNFDKPNEPLAINLPAGLGKVFKKDMEEFIKILHLEIPKAFNNEDYEIEKASILKEFQSQKNQLIEILGKHAESQGLKLNTTNSGIYFIPIVDGKALNENEYANLSEEVKQEISSKSDKIQLEAMDIIRKIKNLDKKSQEKILEWENKIALFAVGIHINDLKEKYKNFENIVIFLDNIQEDILSNLDDFRCEDSEEEPQQYIIPLFKKSESSPSSKYQINLLVDNSNLKGAPIITDFNPTYYNLLGKLEYENEFGSMITDFSLIKGGLFHQANGGFLILQVKDILNNVQAWEALKRVLKTKQIVIENMKEQMGLVSVSTLKPSPIPLNIKVILVGNEFFYQTLYEYDEDFKKLFKIKADFDDQMERTDENIEELSKFVSSFCKNENTLHFDKTAIAKIVEYSSRLVEHQNKLSTKFNDLVEILSESCTIAEIEKGSSVSDIHVKKAISDKIYRSNKHDKKLLELIKDGTIIIDTDQEVIGQINGLTILDMGDYSFGKPARITATTFMGKTGIVNIEREVKMSGTSHSKGVLILSGYIGQKYAQEIPLSLSASLCFEQLYGGIDGDSASSAELYAILSSLGEIPIKQYIAVTGSVNQRGEIQPIGGVNEKIEGFFELCNHRGLDGKHGVIIPHQNVKNLMLNDAVINAVKNKLFHIYPVKTIDEGIEILTGLKAGEKNSLDKYPKNTVNFNVYEKLKKFAHAVVGIGKYNLKN